MAPHTVNWQHVVSIVFGFEIEDQRRVTIHMQRGGSKCRTFETMRCAFAKNAARRPGSVGQMVRHIIEKALDSVGILEAAELAEFGSSECASSISFYHLRAVVAQIWKLTLQSNWEPTMRRLRCLGTALTMAQHTMI